MPWRRSTRAGCTGTPRRGRCMAGILRPKHVNRICFQSGRRGTILSMRGDFASAPGISLRTIPTITRSVIPPLPIVVCGRSAPAFRPRPLLAASSRFGLASATDLDVRSPSLQLANFHGGHALGHKHGRRYPQILRNRGHCRTVAASRKRGHPPQGAPRMAGAQGVGRAPHLERPHGIGVFPLQCTRPPQRSDSGSDGTTGGAATRSRMRRRAAHTSCAGGAPALAGPLTQAARWESGLSSADPG